MNRAESGLLDQSLGAESSGLPVTAGVAAAGPAAAEFADAGVGVQGVDVGDLLPQVAGGPSAHCAGRGRGGTRGTSGPCRTSGRTALRAIRCSV